MLMLKSTLCTPGLGNFYWKRADNRTATKHKQTIKIEVGERENSDVRTTELIDTNRLVGEQKIDRDQLGV